MEKLIIKPAKVSNPVHNTIVVNLDDNSWYTEWREKPPGRQEWYLEGRWYYWIKVHDGQVEAVKLPMEIDYLPEDLYMALRWDEAKPIFTIKRTKLEKIKLGLMVLLVGLFLLFLYIVINSGG